MEQNFKKELKDITQNLIVQPIHTEARVPFDFHSYPLSANQALYVLSLKSGELIYQRNILALLGYHEQEFNFDSPFDLIHENDFPIVKDIIKNTLAFSRDYGLPEESVLCITYRMLKKDGTYIRVQRLSGICPNPDGNSLRYNYSILQDITYMGMNPDVHWDWNSPGLNKGAYINAIKIQPVENLTKRENEVMELILEGIDGYAISKKLGISYNTVKTHRKNIFQKTGCSSAPELMHYIRKGVFRRNS
ncbi:PAS domain-containing protein [Cryomorpha ignava]|uniref:PAS domain-containing protein n=1 Tax=Cryomorpha ignava TaxID=101383 RepID=A0A7K3WSX6_9FLAO|nr:LuxR C-terminal-related transcriptional regulator [Cryomorpha ignava]NEN24638.1 PAS domain-containing protein [Cryomorpha ignava]